ncbi:Adenylate cyclase type 5 [Cichlidogyrus casuarinus]|uniref:adenylate cyclase n=1 Tax=Cichlidogyrus casuarinus TaxID=1844966 RepID=A0ABD2Q0A5_9PLAT
MELPPRDLPAQHKVLWFLSLTFSCCSFILVEIAGLSANTARSSSSKACADQTVRFFNALFAKMDQLVSAHGCYRVRSHPDEYLCLAGYPELRVDHAKICVELALALHSLINSIGESAKVNLALNIAINTGTAYAAVFGRSRIAFDVIGEDIVLLNRMINVTKPGRILVTRTTFDQLPEGYKGESGPFLEPNKSKEKTHSSGQTVLSLYDAPQSASCMSRLLNAINKEVPEHSGSRSGLAALEESMFKPKNVRDCLVQALEPDLNQFPSLEMQLKLAGLRLSKSEEKHLAKQVDEMKERKDMPSPFLTAHSLPPLIDLKELPLSTNSPSGLMSPHFITLAFQPFDDHNPKNTNSDNYLKPPQHLEAQEPGVEDCESRNGLSLIKVDESSYYLNQRPVMIGPSLLLALLTLIYLFFVNLMLLPRSTEFYLINTISALFMAACTVLHFGEKLHKSFAFASRVSKYWSRIVLHLVLTALIAASNFSNLVCPFWSPIIVQFQCQFGLWSLQSRANDSFHLNVIMTQDSPQPCNHCPIPSFVSILCCLVALVPLVTCPPPSTSQALRTAVSLTLCAVQLMALTIVLDPPSLGQDQSNQSDSRREQEENRRKMTVSVHLGYFLQNCMFQLAFAIFTIALPRTLDLLHRLNYLWKIQVTRTILESV